MNSYIQKLLFDISQNSDRINTLIDNGIITSEEITREAINSNNLDVILYTVLNVKGVDILALSEAVIKNMSFVKINEFIKFVNISLDELTDIVCKTNNAFKIYNFAHVFNEKLTKQSINLLASAIIELDDAEQMYCFAKNVKNAPIEELAIAVSKTESVDDIYTFARDFSKVLTPKTMDLLASAIIESKRIPDIIKFAKDVPNAPINKLTDAIIKVQNPFGIYEFAKAIQGIPNAPISKLAASIINLNNNMYISRFIGIKGAPVVLLTEVLIKNKAYLSLIDSPNIKKNPLIDKIVKTIIETKKPKLIYELALVVDTKHLNLLAQSIIDIKNIKYALKFINEFNNDLNPDILSKLNELVNINQQLKSEPKEELKKLDTRKIDEIISVIDSKDKEKLKKYRDEIRSLLLEQSQKVKKIEPPK